MCAIPSKHTIIGCAIRSTFLLYYNANIVGKTSLLSLPVAGIQGSALLHMRGVFGSELTQHRTGEASVPTSLHVSSQSLLELATRSSIE